MPNKKSNKIGAAFQFRPANCENFGCGIAKCVIIILTRRH